MKSYFRHYGPIALLLAGIVLVSALLTALAGPVTATGDTCRVVTTTYPLYLAAKNVVGDTPGVTVQALTGATAGCLHDYQLSPADRLMLDQADLVLVNGAGAEPFLEDIQLPGRMVDTAQGVNLLCGAGHQHHHDHDGYNEHIWTSPRRYAAQVAAVASALATMDTENAAAYRAAAAAHTAQIQVVEKRLTAAAAKLVTKRCVIFHDSLAYLADDLGLEVALSLTVGEESGVSAGDLAAVQRLVEDTPTLLLLYDDQYTIRYPAVDSLVSSSQVLALDTGATGDGALDNWLDAMHRNAILLEKLTEEIP